MIEAPMRLGLNLRGDLAKLDDAEIASRYEALIREKEVRILETPTFARHRLLDRFWTTIFGRGLLMLGSSTKSMP